jgi:predicted amidophosphoribosyltransferase
MSGNFCPFCGTQRGGAGKFCGGCGRVIPEVANCPTCGQVLPLGTVLDLDKGTKKTGSKTGTSKATTNQQASETDPGLVYGSGFSKSDCINCGSKRKSADSPCKVCGYSEE